MDRMDAELDPWILSLITALTGLLLGLVTPLWKQLLARLPQRDLTIVRDLATLVVPLVEREFPQLVGAEKLARATRLVNTWLSRRGLRLTASEIEAAIEKSWLEFETSGQSKAYASRKKKSA